MNSLYFHLARFISLAGDESAGAIETAEKVADGVSRVVFTALERNVLIGVIVLGILGTIAFAFMWARERGAVHQAIEKIAIDRASDRRLMEEQIEKNGDANRTAIKKVQDQMVELFRENTAEFKDLREKDQVRNDRKEDLLRDFAVNTVSALGEMSQHLERFGAKK